MEKKLIVLLIIAAFTLNSCKESNQYQYKRAFVVCKTDDGNWSNSAEIECDSVDMLSVTHAAYWIDGKKFNLFARSYIKILTNHEYKPIKSK